MEPPRNFCLLQRPSICYKTGKRYFSATKLSEKTFELKPFLCHHQKLVTRGFVVSYLIEPCCFKRNESTAIERYCFQAIKSLPLNSLIIVYSHLFTTANFHPITAQSSCEFS